jgi:HSP20 family protein
VKNPFHNLNELERQLGEIAVQLTEVRFAEFAITQSWRPALNAFRCGNKFIVCVELAGVERSSIDVRAERRRLAIRGVRAMPEPSCEEPPALHVLALEIDHGRFERILELPAEVEPEGVTAEHRNGLLWIKLPVRADG